MNIQQLNQPHLEVFSEYNFLEKAAELLDENVIVYDNATGQEAYGVDGYIQYLSGFVNLIPDLKSKVIEQQSYHGRLISRVQMQGKFTGRLKTTEGTFYGNGNPVEIEYQVEQEFNPDGKVRQLRVKYDLPDFIHQLSRRYRPS